MRTKSEITKSVSPEVNRYVPPLGHPLQPYLLSIWRGEDKGKIRRETIFPDGSFSVVFCLAGPHSVYRNTGEPNSFDAGFVSGIKTERFRTQPTQHLSLIGMSLRMDTCAAFLPMPASELTDLSVEAKLVFKDADIMHDRLLETHDFQEQCRLLITWLLSHLRPPAKHKLIRHACAGLRERPTESKVREIARSLGISERHLRRLFLQHVGVSPTRYLRLSRFIKTIHLVPGSSSLTEIAYEAHYTDQAHFCHDFKKITGITPKQYREAVDGIPGHIFST